MIFLKFQLKMLNLRANFRQSPQIHEVLSYHMIGVDKIKSYQNE